jgi:hypothetical protein
MANTLSFADNLKNLRLVALVALHAQENGNQFVKDAPDRHLQEFENYVSKIRTLAGQLEKEVDAIEYLISKRPARSPEKLRA